MRHSLEARPMLCEYAWLQERLCGALFDKYPIDDVNLLTDLPKHGTLQVGNGLWEFQRHGTGVCFTHVPGNEIVDVHAKPVAYPAGIDAWRLIQNLRSKGIETLRDGEAEFDATNEKSLEEMLQQFCREGLLDVSDQNCGLYVLLTDH